MNYDPHVSSSRKAASLCFLTVFFNPNIYMVFAVSNACHGYNLQTLYHFSSTKDKQNLPRLTQKATSDWCK